MDTKLALEEEYAKLLSLFNVDLESYAEAEEFWKAYKSFSAKGRTSAYSQYSLGRFWRVMEDELGSSSKEKSLPEDFNSVWEILGHSISSTSRKVSKKNIAEVNVLTRVFPTGSLNAQAATFESGILVLVDSGLIAFLLEFILILLAYNGTRARLFWKSTLREGLTAFGAVSAIGSLLIRYSAMQGYSPGTGFDYFMELGLDEPTILQLLVGETNAFIIAHEHSHIALGHIGNSEAICQKRTPVGLINLADKQKDEEFAADLNAILTLISMHEDWELYLPFQLAGFCIFLCMDDLITQLVSMLNVSNAFDPPIILDHPPASERLNQIADRFDQLFPGGDILKMLKIFRAAYSEVREESLKLALAGLDPSATFSSYAKTLQDLRERLS